MTIFVVGKHHLYLFQYFVPFEASEGLGHDEDNDDGDGNSDEFGYESGDALWLKQGGDGLSFLLTHSKA